MKSFTREYLEQAAMTRSAPEVVLEMLEFESFSWGSFGLMVAGSRLSAAYREELIRYVLNHFAD